MENYLIENDITVFGKEVKTFPQGIAQAFNELMAALPKNDPRPYYGVSVCTKTGIVYYAAAHETYDGEAEAHHYERYIIEKGNYLAITVTDWLSKTDTIKDVFADMFNNARSDRNKPCIEIYKNDWEMLCLVKERFVIEETALNRDVFVHAFDTATAELFTRLRTFSPKDINTSFASHSWSAAQVGEHLFKSDSSMLRILHGPAIAAERPPYSKVARLKEMFLNFDTRMESPRFVRPLLRTYDKGVILQQLQTSRDRLRQAILAMDLNEMCTTVEEPALSESTRLELLHFVLYHTTRHNHQLKKIQQQAALNAQPDGKV